MADKKSLFVGGGGAIVNMSSTAGLQPLPFNAGWTNPYNGGVGYTVIPGGGTPLLISDTGFESVYVGGSDGAFYRISQHDGTLLGRLYMGASAAISDVTYDWLRMPST